MSSPKLDEFDAIQQIVKLASGLSPAGIRFVRARLLEVLKAPPSTTPCAPKDSSPDVAAAQAKTRELFERSGARAEE